MLEKVCFLRLAFDIFVLIIGSEAHRVASFD